MRKHGFTLIELLMAILMTGTTCWLPTFSLCRFYVESVLAK